MNSKRSKSTRLYKTLLKAASAFLESEPCLKMGRKRLMHALNIPAHNEKIFEQVLETLVNDGLLIHQKGSYSKRKSPQETIRGILHLHPRGFGFVRPEKPESGKEDIFIPKQFTLNAVDGDLVEVKLGIPLQPEKGPEGAITAILERARKQIAGIVKKIGGRGEAFVYAPLLGIDHDVIAQPLEGRTLQRGDRLVLEVIEWGKGATPTECRPIHYIGHISDPSTDIDHAIEQYELRKSFPAEVENEIASLRATVGKQEAKGREDLCHLECFTIDPDRAEDFDDALSIQLDESGNFLLGVHIADVSHYVKPGSAVDAEARLRANSVYFPGFCLPMLPQKLSNQICSLRPNVKRLTASIWMTFDSNGTLLNYRIARSIIKSCKRFTYREAKAVLDGDKESPHQKALESLVTLCKLLKKKRVERGNLEISIPELVVLVDEKGAPVGTDHIEYDITHQLVEEFMLKANEVVAQHLDDAGKMLPYRIHEEPASENLKDFAALACSFGFTLPSQPSPEDLQHFFEEALKTPYGEYLVTSYIRRMRLAVYSPENIGHYGLGLTHYCHFTSPIRRYIDLVVHRTLFEKAENTETLVQMTKQCSEQERIAEKAERSVILLKKLRLLKQMQERDPNHLFEAIITRVQRYGFYFEVIDLMLESFLHVSDLTEDFYEFDETRNRLIGYYDNALLSSGQKIRVMLKGVDLIFLESRWGFISEPSTILRGSAFSHFSSAPNPRGSTIETDPILENMGSASIVEPRGFGTAGKVRKRTSPQYKKRRKRK